MDFKERPIVYGLIAACILGIIIVGAFVVFVGGTVFSNHGFSELFFKNHDRLPVVINENEPLSFSFEVASHNKGTTNYAYNVFTGDQIISSGSFVLPKENTPDNGADNRYNKTVSIDNIRLKSTLRDLGQPQISTTQFNYDGKLGLFAARQTDDSRSAPLVMTDPSQIYYPFTFPGSNTPTALIFNPGKTETLHTTTMTKTKVGDTSTIGQNAAAVEIDGQRISNVGYDQSKNEWTINNDRGIISASANTTTVQYRYAFEKISVELHASPEKNPADITRYEIHFWVVVTDNKV